MGGWDLEAAVGQMFAQWGWWAYGALFLAVLLQTANPLGAVVPGNPLLFVVGLLAKSAAQVPLLAIIAIVGLGAAVGNGLGYATGQFLGARTFQRPRWKSQEPKIQRFFEKHGGRAVFFAFFLPFVRCFVPIFAGSARIPFHRFASGSLLGAFVWSGTFCTAGYLFGEVPAVRQNLELAILAIGAVAIGKMVLSAKKA